MDKTGAVSGRAELLRVNSVYYYRSRRGHILLSGNCEREQRLLCMVADRNMG